MPTRPCWAEISTRAFEDNYRFLESLAFGQVPGEPHADLLAIVKADAYGHSLAICAPAAVRAGARWLGVTSVEEAVAARRFCPQTRILVMGGIFPGQGPALLQHSLTPVVWAADQFEELETAANEAGLGRGSVPVHLEIDTGMSRQGVAPDDLEKILKRFGPHSPLRLEAVTTHLCASDETDGEATSAQLGCLEDVLTRIGSVEPAPASAPQWLSVGASAALLGNDIKAIAKLAYQSGLRLLLRPGLALYGLVPRFAPPFGPDREQEFFFAVRTRLRPVLTWKTRVVGVRDIPSGTPVGYNGTFVATEPMRVALLAAGYADGLDRRLGNRFSLLVRGERAPLVGRISMDQSVLDVTEIPGVEPGDEVVILGTQGSETITAFDHADAAGTIPWEVFTRIGARVARIET
ncbi:MAG TPA: alanine racemase [Terracidiphilus sp.]|jgi:alanine racemase|nr:alanine racemase [Terracidiphilus sp.]